jgi:hypothetical protein
MSSILPADTERPHPASQDSDSYLAETPGLSIENILFKGNVQTTGLKSEKRALAEKYSEQSSSDKVNASRHDFAEVRIGVAAVVELGRKHGSTDQNAADSNPKSPEDNKRRKFKSNMWLLNRRLNVANALLYLILRAVPLRVFDYQLCVAMMITTKI